MRRIAKIFGLLGGLGAVVWAMRDRFVSVAIPREPEPPAFRMPTDPPRRADNPESSIAGEASVPDQEGSDLTEVDGIGPVYAERLRKAGIRTLDQLLASRPEQVAAAAEVALSRAIGWIQAARTLI